MENKKVSKESTKYYLQSVLATLLARNMLME